MWDQSLPDDSTELLLECQWGPESPLWADGYQVDIEDVGFSKGLVQAMLHWANTFVMNKQEQGGYDWVRGFDVSGYDDAGRLIQEKLAEELGRSFQITRFDRCDLRWMVRGAQVSSELSAAGLLSAWIDGNAAGD